VDVGGGEEKNNKHPLATKWRWRQSRGRGQAERVSGHPTRVDWLCRAFGIEFEGTILFTSPSIYASTFAHVIYSRNSSNSSFSVRAQLGLAQAPTRTMFSHRPYCLREETSHGHGSQCTSIQGEGEPLIRFKFYPAHAAS